MLLREKISKVLVRAMQFLHAVDTKLYRNAYNPNPNNLEDLTPHYQEEEGNTYSEAMLWAIKNVAVKNIALTGPYGSGKSSILKSFEADHPEFSYLNISLASFEEEAAQEPDVRKRIEISILQQIFYKVSVAKVPFSRFRRIRNTPAWRFLLSAVLMIAWVVSGTFIIRPKFFERLSWWAEFAKKHGDPILYMAVAIFLAGTIWLLSKLFKNYNSARFQKLNVSHGELELAQEADTSILNKHLDEILYFFEETGYNVVIIEDLDRFQDPEIFTKLRELNNLINGSSQVDRKVTFIYALKDDVFKDNNRTKFFDFLIPVIPVINSSNSGEKLLKKFVDSDTQGTLTDTFILDITLFIEDMRMLKNIYNEYVLYKDKIGLKVNEEKLLGIIVYKNFYPSDFAGLNVNQGLVYESFALKQTTVNELQEANEEKISMARERIKLLENELMQNLAELRSVYALAIIKKLEGGYRYRLGNNTFENSHLTGDAFFAELTANHNITYMASGYGSWQTANFKFKAIENEIDAKLTYAEREKIVNVKAAGEITGLKITIDQLKQQNLEMSGWSLQALINKHSVSVLYKEAAKEKLLTYLLRRGYIDEMYHSYISYFYEGAITRTDMDFVIAVKNYSALAFDFELFKTDQVIKKLALNEYQQKEILNYILVDYLAGNNLQLKREFEAVIAQLRNNEPESDAFLVGYLSKGKKVGIVVKALCKIWPEMWEHVTINKAYSVEQIDEFLRVIVVHADLADLVKINSKGALAIFINAKVSFPSLFAPSEFPKIKQVITKLNLQFEDLEFTERTADIFDFVYKNNHYEISAMMIGKMIGKYSTGVEELRAKLERCNYTTILKSGCDPLIAYINENLDTYLDEVFFELKENVDEAEDVVIKLLNSDIDEDTKIAIINMESVVFEDISELPGTLWTHAFKENKVHADWENLLLYFQEEDKSDEVLTDFLNNSDNFSELSIAAIGKTDGDNKAIVEALSSFVLLNDKLSDDAYTQLIGSVPWIYNSLAFESLSKSKVEILLKGRKLILTKSNYDLLKTHFNGLNIFLIGQNYVKYLANETDYVFDSTDYIYILYSNLITLDQKLNQVKKMDASLIKNATLGDLVAKGLLAKPGYISFDLLKKLMVNTTVTETKVRILNMNISQITKEQFGEMLTLIGGAYAQINIKGKRPSISDNEYNLDLVKRLSVFEYVASYKQSKGKITINTKRK